MSDRSTADERARKRASWPVRKARLTDPDPSLVTTTTVEERVGMMWALALDAWAFAGRELPEYERGDIPITLVRADRA